MAKLKIKKGDKVKVISGTSKGREGVVLEMNQDKSRLVVEGVNLVSKHTKPNAASPQGGIVKKEAPLHVSNLALVDPKSGEATKVGFRMEDGKKVRFSKKSGEVIK